MQSAPRRWILAYHAPGPPVEIHAGYSPECLTPACVRRACTGSERDFAEYCCRNCANPITSERPHGEACERHHPAMARLIVPVDGRKVPGPAKEACVHALQALALNGRVDLGQRTWADYFRVCPSCFDAFHWEDALEALIPAQCPECSRELVTVGAAVGRLVMSS